MRSALYCGAACSITLFETRTVRERKIKAEFCLIYFLELSIVSTTNVDSSMRQQLHAPRARDQRAPLVFQRQHRIRSERWSICPF
jgi:hypothetical protein